MNLHISSKETSDLGDDKSLPPIKRVPICRKNVNKNSGTEAEKDLEL